MSRPPSPHQPRPAHVPLSIRTTITQTKTAPQQQGQSTSPPNPTQQPYPSYPLTISSEKFPKALKLYNKYWMEKSLAQRTEQPQSAIETTSRLHIPTVARSRSVTTPGSSRAYTPSVSNSAYDGVTESVVSFTGEESPSSATPNGSTELIAYNGERVRQRIRRPLTPVSKAKAALIRHLESCWVCRGRRVPCPLEHHDIESLERARQAKARTRQRAQSVQQSRSSNASSLNASSGLQTADQPASGGSLGQMNSLLGVGLADQLLETPSSDPVSNDPQSPALPDPLSEIPSYGSVPNPANLTIPTVPFPNADLYADHQDGQMVALGVLRGYLFFCTYRDGCQQVFDDLETLQIHAETHLSYNRIEHPLRYVCFNCESVNSFPTGPCYSCLNEGTIETRVYGSFIRMLTYQRYGPDGHDFFRNDSSAPFFPYGNFTNTDFGLGGGMDNGNYTTDSMNQGGFYNYQNNTFGNSGPQNDSENDNGYNTPRSSGYPFQGNWARHRTKASPLTARHSYARFLQTYRSHKFLLLTLLLLVAFTLLLKTHEWMFTKSRPLTLISLSHSNLPVFGFGGVLVSFTMCYTYMKKIGVQRIRRAQCRRHRCPLQDLPTLSFHYRQTAPNTFVRGYVFP